MEKPKISVIMPFYNCEHFLDEAIQSILSQTFSDFEFIIINDASKDKSDEVVKKYLADARIIYIKNEKNQKITANLNMALDLAKADVIARMDGDDISEKNRLKEQYEFLEKNPDISLVGSFARLIDEKGNVIGEKSKPVEMEKIKKDIFLYSPMIHPVVMFRKEPILSLGKYDEKYALCEDYELWFRMIFSGKKMTNIPRYLLRYRIHSNSSSKHIREVTRNTFQIRKEAILRGQCNFGFRNLFFMSAHFVLGMIISGRKKQWIEEIYKKYFYGE